MLDKMVLMKINQRCRIFVKVQEILIINKMKQINILQLRILKICNIICDLYILL